MFKIAIHENIIEKLRTKHKVERHEIEECFDNITRGVIEDTREDHKTDPPTNIFVEETNAGRKLKVAFICLKDTKEFVVKTAYEANQKDIDYYMRNTS